MGSKKTVSVHEHFIRGNTTFDHNHFHSYHDKTKKMFTTTKDHIHLIQSKTSIKDEHIHYMTCFTGPAIHCDRGHYHCYYGAVSYNCLLYTSSYLLNIENNFFCSTNSACWSGNSTVGVKRTRPGK